jgi:hypothetical protein
MHEWIARHGLSGPVVTLGEQHVSFTRADFSRWLPPEFPHPPSPRPMTAAELFEGLGLGAPTSVDLSDYEGADVLFDLNAEDLPPCCGPALTLWSTAARSSTCSTSRMRSPASPGWSEQVELSCTCFQ